MHVPPEVTAPIEKLVENARQCLDDRLPPTLKTAVGIPEAVFWLETRNLCNVTEEHIKIEDISKIRPGSKIDIEVSFLLGVVTYRFTIKTIVTDNGVFQLRHPELTDIGFPYSDASVNQSFWKKVSEFAKDNAVPLAGLLLSIFNAALTVMRLKIP